MLDPKSPDASRATRFLLHNRYVVRNALPQFPPAVELAIDQPVGVRVVGEALLLRIKGELPSEFGGDSAEMADAGSTVGRLDTRSGAIT